MSDRGGSRGATGSRSTKGETMTPLDIVRADIAILEAARDALPPHSHIEALIELTLRRLCEEAETMSRAQRKKAA
jgi:hypothetical protein